MRNAPMRFAGLSLRHNPHKLVIESGSNIRELMPPCCEADSVYMGERRQRISGEGEMYGADCLEQYAALDALRKAHTLAKLALPRLRPIYAYLKELELTAEPVDNVLRYRFAFTQAQSPRRNIGSGVYYTTVAEDESLWDIAYAYDTDIERLVELNPGVSYIDKLRRGLRVKIC